VKGVEFQEQQAAHDLLRQGEKQFPEGMFDGSISSE
jgi:hypothetical protein